MPKPTDKPLSVVIISGATGRTATQVVNAALAQFERPHVRVVKRHNVRTVTAARKIVRELESDHTVICHSLVSPAVRDAVVAEASRRMIPAVDILGRVLAVLSDHLGVAPQRKPGLSYKLQKEYFDRIDAVSFTLEHDDGAGLSTLAEADVVLVGVSRVSKSVTCFYLAYRGIRAANVPLIPGVDLPDAIDRHAQSESHRPDRDSQPPADGSRSAASQAGCGQCRLLRGLQRNRVRTAVCAEGHQEIRLAQNRRLLHGGGRSRGPGAAEYRAVRRQAAGWRRQAGG